MILVFVAIVGTSLSYMYGTLEDQQNLTEITNKVMKQQERAITDITSLEAITTDDGSIKFKNSGNSEVKIVQIRVYDDDGNFVRSFPIDFDVAGNAKLEMSNMTSELRDLIKGN
jgi:hypothetical protein